MTDSTVRVIFMGDSDGAVRAVGRLDSRMGGLGQSMARTAKLGATIFAGALAGGILAATKAAIGFDRSMRNVNSIAKVNERQFQALEKRVLALGKVSGQAPKVLADGLYDIVSSGFKANDAIKILGVSAKAATAGMTDTATASKAVVAVLNAYHLGAGRAKAVSDVLFQTVNKGVLTFSELSQQIGDVLPYASRLNIPLTDLGGAMATLTLHGVNAAESATQLKQVMASTIAPSKDLKKEIKALGYESGQAMLHQLGFQGTVRKLSDAAGGNIGVLHSWFPNIRALSGFLGISGKNAKQLADNIKSMTGASKGAGATAKAFAEQGKSIAVQWDKAMAGLTASGIKLGTTLFPALATGIGYLSDFAGWLDKLAGEHSIRAKVEFVGDSAERFAERVRRLVSGALFGVTTKPASSAGPMIGAPQFEPGFAQKAQQALSGMNWKAIGGSIGAAIGAGIVISADRLDGLVTSIVGAMERNKGKIGAVGLSIVLSMINAMSDPDFWFRHWALIIGVATTVIPVGLGAKIGFRFAEVAFKLFGATAGRFVLAGLARLPGVVGQEAPRFAASIGKFIADAAAVGIAGMIRFVNRLLNEITRPFGRLGGLLKVLLVDGIVQGIAGAIGAAYSWGASLGQRIADGVIAGLRGLPGRIASAVNPFSGPSGKPATVGGRSSPRAGVAGKAAGDVINHPMLAVIGEDAPRWPEWVIPSNPMHRRRALGLLSQATSALGLPGFAAGGGPQSSAGPMVSHSLRKRGPVNLKSVVGAARSSLANLAKVQQSVQDAQRTYDQTDRLYGISDEALTMDVLDDPSDPTNTGTHAVRNEAGIAAHLGELNDLVNRKGGIMALLRDEQQAIEDAIKAIQKAIDELLAAIKELQQKAKDAGAEARMEHRAASGDALSVSRKGGLQDQVSAERAKKKPSKSIIARLESQIKDAGRSHDRHETAAKKAETDQGRYQKQAQDDAGRVKDLRGSLADLAKQKHDLPFDIRDQELDVIQLQANIARTSGTTSTTYTPTPASTTSTGGSAGGATTITDVISADVLAELQRLRDALGLQTSQFEIIGGMPSFRSGIDVVPDDMVAQLHKGEGVLTAEQNAERMSNQTAGGPFTIHVTGVAITDQMDAWVEQNGQRISAQVISTLGRDADRMRRENRTR